MAEFPSTRLPFHVLAKPIGANMQSELLLLSIWIRWTLHGERSFRMTDDVLEAFHRLLHRGASRRHTGGAVAWQEGADPDGVGFLPASVELQKKHARPGLRIANALQTNGILLNDDWAHFSTMRLPGRHKHRRT